jgi:peptidoglycan-associated lipoprotein
MNHRTAAHACTLAATLLAAGCGTSTDLTQNKAPVETRRPGSTPAATNTTTPAAQSRVTTVDTAAPAATATTAAPALAATNQRIVYFDFDSFVIKDEFKPMIESHARALAALKTRRLTIEGHTDERGGSEYNLALGQKRAEAVARTLALLGAGPTQTEAVSFGKERPADPGHGEAAWAKNRRAELKDR